MFGCSIEGCKMMGSGKLENNFDLKISFLENRVTHFKGKKNSFKSRHLRKADREDLGKMLENVKSTSKIFHAMLADDKKTNMDSGRLSINSKNVCSQVKSEHKKNSFLDKSVFESLRKLKENYLNQTKEKKSKDIFNA